MTARVEDRSVYSETLYPRLHFGWSDLTSVTDGRAASSEHRVRAVRPDDRSARAAESGGGEGVDGDRARRVAGSRDGGIERE